MQFNIIVGKNTLIDTHTIALNIAARIFIFARNNSEIKLRETRD